MLRRSVGVALALVAGCGGGGSGNDDGGDLAGRLRAVLEADGGAVDGDVGAADVVCPTVDDAQPGDLATCVLTLDSDREVEVDVEFQEDGTITVVAVQER